MQKTCPSRCDVTKAVRQGRACYVCSACGKDITLEVVLFTQPFKFSTEETK